MQILKAKETDQRAALFAKAIKNGQDMQAANRKLLLRMRLWVALALHLSESRTLSVCVPFVGNKQTWW